MTRIAAILLAIAALAPAHCPGEAPPQFEQRIGVRLPLETSWIDESGRAVSLGSVFHGRPAVLMFGYHKCPQLCSVVERGAVDSLRDLGPSVGREFDFIYLSIDPTDTAESARAGRAAAARLYGRGDSIEGWHYLTGSEPAIRAAADAAGFQYRKDKRSAFFSHPAGLVVVTPEGIVSRYFPGLDFSPDEEAAALRRAGEGKTGESVYNLIVECFRGDGVGGRYGPLIWRTLEGAVALTVLALAGGILWMLREERRSRSRPSAAS